MVFTDTLSTNSCSCQDRALSWAQLIVAVFFLCSAAPASASEDSWDDFKLVPSTTSGAQPSIIGGRKPVDPMEWPATFKLQIGTEICTATAIGPQAIITAAHCVPNHSKGRVDIGAVGADGERIELSVECEWIDAYLKPSNRYDVALCFVLSEMSLPNIPGTVPSLFESLALTDYSPKVDDRVLLQGYGCRVLGGSPTSILYIGEATISVATAKPTIVTRNGAAVCDGDSGGAATVSTSEGRRWVVALNRARLPRGKSSLVYLGNAKIASFIHSWAERKGTEICGVTPNMAGCHE